MVELHIYEDSLYTNIIGEFALDKFLKENQVRSPVVRTEYVEVQEINKSHTGPCIWLLKLIRNGYQSRHELYQGYL